VWFFNKLLRFQSDKKQQGWKKGWQRQKGWQKEKK
jgi:hypothetical protein